MPSEATTVVLSRRVRPGLEEPFARWVSGATEAVRAFPGFVREEVVPPVAGAQPEWVFVFTFDSPSSLRAWVASEERRAWLARSEPLVLAQGPAQVISGLEQLFGLVPPDVAPPPPVWKVACSVLLGLYPVTLLNMRVLGPQLAGLPLPLRALVTTAVLVILMTWVVMPLVTRALKPWLYPARRA